MRRPLLIIFVAVAIASAMPLVYRSSEAQVPLPESSGGLFRTEVLVTSGDRGERLEGLGVTRLSGEAPGPGVVWTILADEIQLETLAQLGYRPAETAAVGQLDTSGAGLLFNYAFRALANAASEAEGQDPENPDVVALSQVAEAASLLDQETVEVLAQLQGNDDDADGLTNTQEQWWCTNLLNADSDGDGTTDGAEAAALRASARNDIFGTPASTGRAPSTGKPTPLWPRQIGDSCPDSDFDSVPDAAERFELGFNASLESTDRDKFDDGQELYGLTDCPGSAGFCGYGALPRDSDFGVVTAAMPAFVRAPGNHPMVAAFPIPEVDVVESSLRVQAVTTITSSNTVTSGTERSYSTSKTEGTSTSVADTVTWNSWQESSTGSFSGVLGVSQVIAQSGGGGSWLSGGRGPTTAEATETLVNAAQCIPRFERR